MWSQASCKPAAGQQPWLAEGCSLAEGRWLAARDWLDERYKFLLLLFLRWHSRHHTSHSTDEDKQTEESGKKEKETGSKTTKGEFIDSRCASIAWVVLAFSFEESHRSILFLTTAMSVAQKAEPYNLSYVLLMLSNLYVTLLTRYLTLLSSWVYWFVGTLAAVYLCGSQELTDPTQDFRPIRLKT